MQSLPVPQEFRGRRVLVADDNAFNRTIIFEMLTLAGIDVVLTKTGSEACAAIASAMPDLVFMDVRMPGMDGIEATHVMRTSGFSKPIVGLSAATSNADQSACKQAGMSDFLAKPIDADELWGCLTRWLAPYVESKDVLSISDEAPDNSAEIRFLGNAESLARACEAFIACHRDDGMHMRNMLMTGNYAGMSDLVHALKGSAATIGMDALSKLALALEKKIRAHASTGDLLQLIDWIDDCLIDLVENPRAPLNST